MDPFSHTSGLISLTNRTRLRSAQRSRSALLWLCAACLMLVFAGDTQGQLFNGSAKKLFSRNEVSPIPNAFSKTPTQQELIRLLQQRQSNFKQLSSDIIVSMDGLPKLRGSMQMELPRRLRVKAGVMGVSQFGVDVGSNNDLFWVWTKVNLPGQRPAVFYSTHEDFKNSSSQIRQAIPLEPVWLVEGLGLIEFLPGDVHHGPIKSPDGFLKLYTVRQTASEKTTRVITLHPTQGVVLQQALYDDKQNLIAYTNTSKYRWFQERRISLPENIDMFLLQGGQRMKMAIEFSDFKFDSLFGDPDLMWTVKPPADVPTIDLSKVGVSAAKR